MGRHENWQHFHCKLKVNIQTHGLHDQCHNHNHEEFLRMHKEFHRQHQKEFRRYHRYFRYAHPSAVLLTLVILYLLFSWAGIQGIGVFFVALIGIKEIISLILLMRLENRIFKPIEKLRQGVDEIAQGNYNIKIEYNKPNDLGLLIASFNEMAQELYESEIIKNEYEENRKTLIANISHDLKTPITAIQGYIEALLDGTASPSENKDKYLQTIYRNTVYINKLIDDLLLFSKLDMQKLDFQYENVKVLDFMDDLMQEYKFDLEERKVQFQYIAQLQQDYYLNLDRKRLHQALNNVIGNAVKYGPENGLSIQVAMYQQDQFICIAIQDNGPGIPEDKLPYIFDRFYRIDTQRTKDIMSTGLGLAIAKELVEAHGGEITVSSIENEGTCFTVKLPISRNNESGVEA